MPGTGSDVPTARELVWVAIGLTAATLVITFPLIFKLANRLVYPSGDPRLNAWILAWVADRLPHALRGVWSPPVFYPYHNTLAFSEPLLAIGIVVAPVWWLSHNAVLTYNVAFLLSFIGSGLGAYLLVKRLTRRVDAAWVGAFAFAFAPYRASQLQHLQVLTLGWLPVALWALDLFFARGSRKAFAVFVGAFVAQTFSNAYSFFFTMLASAGVVAAHVSAWRPKRRGTLAVIVVTVALGGLALWPAVSAFFEVWRDHGEPNGVLRTNSADLSTYLQVAPRLPGARWLPGVSQPEGNFFPGIVVTALVVVAISRALSRRREERFAVALYGLIGLAALVVSLGPTPTAWGRPLLSAGPYVWLGHIVPLWDTLRVPARFGALTVLCTSVLAGVGASAWLPRAGRWAVPATATICAVIVFEGCGGVLRLDPESHGPSADDKRAYAWLSQQSAGPLIELPTSTLALLNVELDYQYAALAHGHPIVNGMSRRQTGLDVLLGGSASPLADANRVADALPLFRTLGIRYVFIRPARYLSRELGERTADRFAAARADVSEASRFGTVRVFTLRAPPSAPPPEPVESIVPTAFKARASGALDRLPFAFDGDPATRWLTGHPQDGSEWIAVDFDHPRDVGRVDLVTSERSLRDYPRRLEISASNGPEPARLLYDGGVLVQLGRGLLANPAMPTISIPLPPNRTSTLMIHQRGTTDRWYWSVDELAIFARR